MAAESYRRILDLLRFARASNWLSLIGGLTYAVIYGILVLILGLFIELVDSRGRIPHWASLTTQEQAKVAQQWQEKLTDDDRQKALEHIGLYSLRDDEKGTTSPELTQRLRRYQALQNTETLDNLTAPAATKEARLDWAKKQGLTGDIALELATLQELRWRACVWHLLNTRVGNDAAASYQPEVTDTERVQLPAPGEDSHRAQGLLSLVVRHRDTPIGRVAGFFASFNSWTWNGTDANRNYLTGLFIFSCLLICLRVIVLVVINGSAQRATLEIVTRLRRSIYHQASRQGAPIAQGNQVDDVSFLFTKQVEEVHDAINWQLTNRTKIVAQIIVLLLIAALTNIWVSVVFLLFAIIIWSVSGELSQSVRRQSRRSTRESIKRLELLLESLRSVQLVKSHLMEIFNQNRIERQLTDFTRTHQERVRGEIIVRPIIIGAIALACATLLFFAGRMMLREALSFAALGMLAVCFVSLYTPLRTLWHGRKLVRKANAAAANIYEYLDKKAEMANYPDAEFFPGLNKGIEFDDVVVRHSVTNQPILKKLSFKIKAKQKIGFVSSNQEELEAITGLFPRFYDPADGVVKIDGRDIKWITGDSLRAQIGSVMQQSLVFNDSVGNNIGCGDASYSMPQIIEAAKLAHAHQFITRLPYGYETPIGDLGHALKPGELFRIALARAILRDPSIYLIEEPREAFDDDTKELIDDTFSRIFVDKTVIFLPHRMSTLRDCDKIFLIHDGKLAAEGEHRQLITENELYRHLYYLEFNPFADATN